MIHRSEDIEKRASLAVADKMVAAARTAPKACGVDNIEAFILDGKEKEKLALAMKKSGEENNIEFYIRDGANIQNSHCVVLIGIHDKPLGLPQCGYCGFENCGKMKKAGAICTFNTSDLGIAVGSAISIATDNRIDNRVFYSAGRVAIESGFFAPDVRVAYAIPLHTSAKNIFFDRNPGAVLF